MRIEARAKINWTLDIVGRRADGYHLMDMLMQPITLCDLVTLTPADAVTLTASGHPYIAPDEKNLAYRAAMLLKAETGYPGGVALHVEKHIPAGAGLGGGSADAAAVLWGLNRLWGLNLSPERLRALGLRLGADVPFCLTGGLQRVTGIGEVMTPLGGGPSVPLVVIQPCAGLSTKEIFSGYHAQKEVRRPQTEAAQSALLQGDLPALSQALGNALEGVSCALQPAIGQAVEALRQHGAIGAAMSGSGSAVFGFFETEAAAEGAAHALKTIWESTFLCAGCKASLAEV